MASFLKAMVPARMAVAVLACVIVGVHATILCTPTVEQAIKAGKYGDDITLYVDAARYSTSYVANTTSGAPASAATPTRSSLATKIPLELRPWS